LLSCLAAGTTATSHRRPGANRRTASLNYQDASLMLWSVSEGSDVN